MLKVLWGSLVYRPLVNILLVLLLVFGGNLGWAIVVLTILIRLLLWNNTKQQAKMASGGGAMGDMQTKLKELEEKYKDQPEVLAKESMKLMKTDGLGSLKGCLTLLIQLPIFIGLINVIRMFATAQSAGGHLDTSNVYSFLMPYVAKFMDTVNVNQHFFGMDLFANHNIPLTIVGAIFVFLQTKLTTLMQSKNKPAQPMMGPGGQAMPDMTKMMGPMNLFMVIMMGSFIYTTASGVGIYLVLTTLVSVIQYTIQNRELVKISWLTRNVNKDAIVLKK